MKEKEIQVDQIFEQIASRYKEPHRHYHNLDHIKDGLGEIKKILPIVKDKNEFIIAWLFHDIIYDPKSNTNEQDSANFAAEFCQKMGLDQESIDKIKKMIIATEHKKPGETLDEKLICDIDLTGLGKGYNIYKENWEKIRQEYKDIPLEKFNQGRITVLSKFYNRPHLFQTSYFRKLYEQPARNNFKQIQAELGK